MQTMKHDVTASWQPDMPEVAKLHTRTSLHVAHETSFNSLTLQWRHALLLTTSYNKMCTVLSRK